MGTVIAKRPDDGFGLPAGQSMTSGTKALGVEVGALPLSAHFSLRAIDFQKPRPAGGL